jgi:phosphate starvation-inducible membrane PsiE
VGLPLPGAVRHRRDYRLCGGSHLPGHAGKGGVSVDDILLLFIYLELGAMVGIYFKTNHMPIRFLLYVAITALTRLLIGDVSHHKAPDVGLL